MARFPGVDYLLIDSLFSEQELLVRQSARQFVEDRVIPIIRDCYRDGRFPKELIPEIGELGFMGANLEGYGCAGLNNVEYGLIMQEIERGDSGLRSFVSVQGALVMYPIYTYGSTEQKDHWLPQMQSGKAIGCFGLTEPGFGSNPAGMQTRAKQDGNQWILNGEKTWITNGSMADVAIVWARAEEGIRGFLVEKGTPGFTTSDIHGKLSMRASVTSSLALSDCRVPASAMLPWCQGTQRSPELSLAGALRHRMGRARRRDGLLRDRAPVFDRSQTVRRNRPIASHQLVQEKLAWMITEITKAQLLAIQAGRVKDQGKIDPAHISMLKRNNVAMALECARSEPRSAGRQRHHGRISHHAPHVQFGDREDL